MTSNTLDEPRKGDAGWRRRGRPFKISRMYAFYKARQIDGSIAEGSRYGSFGLTAARVSAGWGAVAEHRWPYPRGPVVWPPVEPLGLDQIARFNRHLSHFRVRSIEDCRRCLADGVVFGFSVPITRDWYQTSDGAIAMPRGPFLELQHAVTAVGYNDHLQQLTFLNSWGPEWGQSGVGYLPYDYFKQFVSDAWFVWPKRPARWLPNSREEPFLHRKIIARNTLGNAVGIIDIWDVAQDVRIGWCFMTLSPDGGYLEIEDYFLKAEYYGTGHQRALSQTVLDFCQSEELPLRLWVPHADTKGRAANFRNLNDFIRAAGLNLRKCPHTWAAYLGE